MYFYINNNLVYTLSDSTYSHGQVGLAMYTDHDYHGTYYADWAILGRPVISSTTITANQINMLASQLPSSLQSLSGNLNSSSGSYKLVP
jgi:hypothetical protein